MNFEKMIEQFDGLIWMLIHKYSVYGMSKQDVYQECLMKIYDEQKKYKNTFALSTFLHSILKNFLLDLNDEQTTMAKVNKVITPEGNKITLKTIKDFDFDRLLIEGGYTQIELDALERAYSMLRLESDKVQDIVFSRIEGETFKVIGERYNVSKQRIQQIYAQFINKVKRGDNNE